MSDIDNRREFSRVQLPLDIEIFAGDRTILSQIEDLSLNGILVGCVRPLDLGTRCQVIIRLDGPDGRHRVEATGVVSRQEAGAMALQLEELAGVESYEHLCNLVLYNSPVPDKAAAEIESHIGLRRP